MRGRPRKPTAEHERDGTLREDRHGGRRREPAFGGEPARPKGMGKDAAELWDVIVPHLVGRGVAKATDAAALELLCFWWGKWRILSRKKRDDLQHDSRLAMASKQWNAIAAKFGLTPADRARLEVPEGGDLKNPFEAFMQRSLSSN